MLHPGGPNVFEASSVPFSTVTCYRVVQRKCWPDRTVYPLSLKILKQVVSDASLKGIPSCCSIPLIPSFAPWAVQFAARFEVRKLRLREALGSGTSETATPWPPCAPTRQDESQLVQVPFVIRLDGFELVLVENAKLPEHLPNRNCQLEGI